jgi:hypothetical protein
MNNAKESFNHSKAIGDNGERAVKFLIDSMHEWECVEFGVENRIQRLKEIVRGEFGPIAKKLKKMPDFVAFNKETNETLLIEVKYRSNSKNARYMFDYLEGYQEYWEGTKLIIVRPDEPHFLYVDLEKLDEKMKKVMPIKGGCKEFWDLKSMQQDIKELFPKLSDEALQIAKRLILPKL